MLKRTENTICEWWSFLHVGSVWAAYKSLFLHLSPFWICLPNMIHFFLFQVLYKEDFERNKGKGFSMVADTPELQRVKKTQDQISNVRHSQNSIYWCASLNITSIAIFLKIWYIHCVLPLSFISSRFPAFPLSLCVMECCQATLWSHDWCWRVISSLSECRLFLKG